MPLPDFPYQHLLPDSPQRERAIGDLRAVLLRGLSHSLDNRYGKRFSAEDVVQEALVRILESIDQFEGRSKFITWAMTIATRVGISMLRRKYHEETSLDSILDDSGKSIQLEVEGFENSAAIHRKEILNKLEMIIESDLSAKQRTAIRAFLSEFSTDDIAQLLHSNRNSVYKLIYDARVKLKVGLERNGITIDDVVQAYEQGG